MADTSPPKDAIRNAATIVLVRQDSGDARVLMGQRGKNAAFMPSKFVFPGGAIDPQDHDIAPIRPLRDDVLKRLSERTDAGLAPALAMTAVRELWEETGLALAQPGDGTAAGQPSEWQSFAAAGHAPDAGALEFIFRAVTPPGRPRRFDARFFLTDAAGISGDPDDFSLASDELSHLSWLTLTEARGLDLPFITEVVLAEVEARLAEGPEASTKRAIPFFYHQDGQSFIDRL